MMTKISVQMNESNRVDVLDGVALTHGEKLNVQWPDGTTEQVEVTLVARSLPSPEQKAYARVPYHGAIARVRLALIRGLLAERVVVEPEAVEPGAEGGDLLPFPGTEGAAGSDAAPGEPPVDEETWDACDTDCDACGESHFAAYERVKDSIHKDPGASSFTYTCPDCGATVTVEIPQ